MKLEQLLKVYWNKGIFWNLKLIKSPFSASEFLSFLSYIGKNRFFYLLKRIELSFFRWDEEISILLNSYKKKILNLSLAKIAPVNVNLESLDNFHLVRFFLIKSYRGRCFFLGKPANGQRTWSNGWNSYLTNYKMKRFFFALKKLTIKKETVDTKNYFVNVKKKQKKKLTTKIKLNNKFNKLKNWF